ncbi:MAG: hypothetical protein KIT27_04080 [Legionellales bacterium]|nr:hypothetical protein [Legionellales bacterium]
MSKRIDFSSPLALLGIFILGLLLILGLGYGYLYYRLTSQARQDINNIIKQTRAGLQIDYGSLRGNVFTNDIILKNIEIKPLATTANPVSIQEIRYNLQKNEDDQLIGLTLHVKEMQTQLTEQSVNPLMKAMMQEMNVDKLKANINLLYRYLPIEKKILIKLSQEMTGIGTFNLGAILVRVENTKTNSKAILNSAVMHIRLQYIDHGFVKKLVDKLTAMSGGDRQAFFNKLDQTFQEKSIKERPLQAPIVQKTWQQILVFLKNPQKITFDLKPDEPVAMFELFFISKAPQDILKRLNLQVIVNQ